MEEFDVSRYSGDNEQHNRYLGGSTMLSSED